jgi:hypothetical protein
MMDVLREKVLPTKDKVIIVSKCTSYLNIIRGMLEIEKVSYCEGQERHRGEVQRSTKSGQEICPQDKKFVHRTGKLSSGRKMCPQENVRTQDKELANNFVTTKRCSVGDSDVYEITFLKS